MPARLRKGLLVKHHPGPKDRDTGQIMPAGWYVWVWLGNQYQAVSCLRFEREKDSQMAADALRKAGLDSAKKLLAAGVRRVARIAFEALEW